MTTRLLFVHKDINSKYLTRSDDLERRNVHRHVQVVTRDQKKQTRLTGSQITRVPVVLRTKFRCLDSGFADSEPARKAIRGTASVRNGVIASGVPAEEQQVHTRAAAIHPTKTHQHSPTHGISSTDSKLLAPLPIHANSTDPFGASVVQIGASYHTLLQYFIHVSHPRTWYSESKAQGSYTFQRSASEIVASCVENAMSMFTMLASMASQMHYFESHEPIQSPTVIIQKALVATRHHVSTEAIVAQLVFVVDSLANAEFYRFNVSAARLHICAVKAFVDQLGGLEMFPRYLKEWFLSGDEFIAAELGEKPLWPPTKVDPGSWRGPLNSTRTISWYSDLLEDQDCEEMPAALECIIADIEEYRTLSQNLSQSSLSSGEKRIPGLNHWLHLRACSTRHRLLSMQFADPIPEAVRLALLAFCYMTNTMTGRRRTMQVVASRLRILLTTKNLTWRSRDMHLWVLLVGALASENSALQRDWFVHQLISHSNEDSARSHHDLDGAGLIVILESLSYFEPVQLPMIRDLVTDIAKVRHRTAVAFSQQQVLSRQQETGSPFEYHHHDLSLLAQSSQSQLETPA